LSLTPTSSSAASTPGATSDPTAAPSPEAPASSDATPPNGNRKPFSRSGTSLKLELERAHAQIAQQQLLIETLQGRGTALHLGTEEASAVLRRPWGTNANIRFAHLPAGPPAVFAGDALQELLSHALPATIRRVSQAAADARQARQDSERAEQDADATLSDIFKKFASATGPNNLVHVAAVEAALRQAAHRIFTRAMTHSSRLRGVLRKLEDEADAMATTHAADMRAACSRLIEQRDATLEVALTELRSAEVEGAGSIRGLTARLEKGDEESATLRIELTHSDAALRACDAERTSLLSALASAETDVSAGARSIRLLEARLDDSFELLKAREAALAERTRELAQTRGQLERAVAGRHAEERRRRTEQATMRAEVEALESEGSGAACGAMCLRAELGEEESARVVEVLARTAQKAAADEERKRVTTELKAQLRALRTEARATESALKEQVRLLTIERDAAEAGLAAIERGFEAAKGAPRCPSHAHVVLSHPRLLPPPFLILIARRTHVGSLQGSNAHSSHIGSRSSITRWWACARAPRAGERCTTGRA
jgi:hypothetical protein